MVTNTDNYHGYDKFNLHHDEPTLVELTFVTFTRNSAKHLARLLSNVRDIASEIVMIDGYSSDETVEIAKRYDATIYQRPPFGYADPDRMFALRMATNEWILYLDSDEILSPRLQKELKSIIQSYGNQASAFRVARVYVSDNGTVLLGHFYPDRQIRVLRKSKVVYSGLVHEHPIVYGRIHNLPEMYYIIHFGEAMGDLPKILKYARLEAAQYYRPRLSLRAKPLYWLAPFGLPLLLLYYLLEDLMRGSGINSATILPTVKMAFYRNLVWTFMKLRNKDEKSTAKLIEEKGLIQLLNLG